MSTVTSTAVPVRLEYLEDTREGTIWRIEALHVTTTKNRRKYTEQELMFGARSLSYRPLNINHNEAAMLPYPENCTLDTDFDFAKRGVVGRMRIADEMINKMIKSGKINRLSVEQLPIKGEKCDSISCEQLGVTFVGLALLTEDTTPGDGDTRIMAESANARRKHEKVMVPFKEVMEPASTTTTTTTTIDAFDTSSITTGTTFTLMTETTTSANESMRPEDVMVDGGPAGGPAKTAADPDAIMACVAKVKQTHPDMSDGAASDLCASNGGSAEKASEAYRRRVEEQAIARALLDGLQQK